MQRIRTFIALPLPDTVRARVAELILLLAETSADVKWVDTSALHMTLNFLGNVPESDLAEVCRHAQRAAQACTAMSLQCCGVGAFPSATRPKVLWLGLHGDTEELLRLQAALETELDGMGFPREVRRFRPHVTLGRVRRSGPAVAELQTQLEAHESFDAGSFQASEVVVYASRLARGGPAYTVLGRARLG